MTPAKAAELSNCGVLPGDVLIAKVGDPPGTSAVYPESEPPAVITQDVIRIRPDQQVVDANFLRHWLNSPSGRHEVKQITVEATRARFPLGPFKKLSIPLPPLSEQKRIAGILDKADSIRRKRQQAIGLTEQFLRSTFLDMFGDPVTNPKGWPVVPAEEILTGMQYGTSTKCSESGGSGFLPVLRIPNVIGGAVNFDDLKYATLEDKERDRLLLRHGDILFVRTNGNPEYIGRCAVFHDERACLFASYLIRAQIREGVEYDIDFLKDVISFPTYRLRLIRHARTTAGNYNISTSGLKQLKLFVPPVELQRDYMTVVNKVASAQQRNTKQTEESDNLFNSLVQRAFRGEL